MKAAEKDPAWRAAVKDDRVPEKYPAISPGQGGELAMALMTMREALNQAMREEMTRDPSVFLLGEEVGALPGRRTR